MWLTNLILLSCAMSAWTNYSFISKVAQEVGITQLLIYPDYCSESFLQQLLVKSELSVVLHSISRPETPGIHFARMLHISCVPETGLPREQLKRFLGERSIFYISTPTKTGNFSSQEALNTLLWHCYSLKILRVIALLAEDELFYYRFQPYPNFQLEQLAVEQRPFFLPRLPNMQRQPLLVLPDNRHPRTIIYTDWRTGAQVLAGSVGNFVKTLAWKLNSTLQYPEQSQSVQTLHPKELMSLAEQLQIDVPMGQVPLMEPANLSTSSYPFELSHVCLMIPIAQPIPIRDIYLILDNWQHILMALAIINCFGFLLSLRRYMTGHQISLVDFILNDVALRGVLGQSFKQSLKNNFYCSFLYLLLGILGLNLSTVHQAALGAMLTHPPRYFQARSFADVQRVQFPLMVDLADFGDTNILDEMHLKVRSVYVKEFNHHRDNMNMSHIYFASPLKWNLLNTQQKYFSQEVFLYSKEACFKTLVFVSFMLPSKNWFLEPINQLILDVRANGLFQHWFHMHFYDMAAADLISFKDPLERPPLRFGGPLQFKDLQWIWLGHAILLAVATLVFLLEIVIKKLQKKY